jgi:hypothetical protein
MYNEGREDFDDTYINYKAIFNILSWVPIVNTYVIYIGIRYVIAGWQDDMDNE